MTTKFKRKSKFAITRTFYIEGEPENVSERILWLRHNKGYRQEDMAELIGCTRSNYANKKSTAHGFSSDQLALIGEEFNLNMNWLFFGIGRPYRKQP